MLLFRKKLFFALESEKIPGDKGVLPIPNLIF